MFGRLHFCVAMLLYVVAAGGQQNDVAKPAAPSEVRSERERRVELNLLGQTDIASGESRRNENIQFNLVDNNALKELNIRLGASATIVRSFSPEQGYFGAEFGNAPSPVMHVAPSTQSRWHGNVFYAHQNSVFSARSFFQAGDVQPARENTYGFVFGMPAGRRGYFSMEGKQDKLRGSVNGNVLVPKPDERTPLATDPDDRAIVERFLAAYPAALPNRTDINPRALNANAPQSIDNNEASLRFDQDLWSRDRVILQYRFLAQSVEAFQLVGGQNPNTDTKSHRARVSWHRGWNAVTVTDVSFGFDRVGSLLLPDDTSVGPMVSTSGLQTLGPLGNIPINRAHNLFLPAGRVQRVAGSHVWGAGFSFLRRQFNGIETDAHRGFYSFTNDFGRNGIENLRMGTPTQHIISIGNVHRGFRNSVAVVFAGDTWRVLPTLTLDAGLRYEVVTRPYEANQLNEIPYDCDCNNLAPRFGFAWKLPRWAGVVRGAYGLHFGEIFPVTFTQVRFSPPGSTKYVVTAPKLSDPLRSIKQSGDKPDALGNLYLLDPELATPYSHQYNFSWEPEFSRAWRLQLGYVGSRSHKLLVMWYHNRAHPVAGIPQTTATINQRRPIPGLAEIRWVLNGSRGYFDAARVSLVAPRYHGFTVDAAYWFSKAIDLGADYTNTAYDSDSRLSRSQWEYETHKDRKALSTFDQPHAFLLRTTYETPVARSRSLARRLAGGWNVSAILLLKSGTPFSVNAPDGPGYGNVDGNGGDRPNLLDTSILGRTIGHPNTSVQLLPLSAFGFIAPTGTSGTLGVNVFRKGAIHNVNAALARTWRMRAETTLTLRAESINLFNTPQFAEPGFQLGSPEFGHITNTLNDGRTFRFLIQFGW